MLNIIICIIAGLGAGLGTGFAGMSAAAVISPMLITFLHMDPYMAVGIALASDVLASAVSAYTYGKNKNLDIKNGLIMMLAVLCFTMVGSYVASVVPKTTMGNFSVFMTLLLGVKFIVKPVVEPKKRFSSATAGQKAVRSVLCGAMVGFICGFVGAGGGMMMLLVLTSVLGYELKTAVGTSAHRCRQPFFHRRRAGLAGTGGLRDQHTGVRPNRRVVRQQSAAQNAQPYHRCHPGAAGGIDPRRKLLGIKRAAEAILKG